MTRIKLLASATFAVALGAGQDAAASDAAASRGGATTEAPPATIAGPEAGGRPAGATQLACFGGLEDGQAILAADASGGRFGGTTAKACRANGGRPLRALRSPAIATGRPIVG